jgi:hypothetical protein
LYNIKAGTGPHDKRAEALANALLSDVAEEKQRDAQRIFRAAEQRAKFLSHDALRFVSTAEHVARQLAAEPHLEWSPAVIGLCKAVEAEIVGRVLRPLAVRTGGLDLTADRTDKDFGRLACFCTDPTRKPPELGTFGRFLQVAIHSEKRRATSTLLITFFKLCAEWVGSHWLLESDGFHPALESLITTFRNRAAHIDELSKQDYLSCRKLVIGSDGVLWKIILATQRYDCLYAQLTSRRQINARRASCTAHVDLIGSDKQIFGAK